MKIGKTLAVAAAAVVTTTAAIAGSTTWSTYGNQTYGTDSSGNNTVIPPFLTSMQSRGFENHFI